jgi:integrase
VSVKIGRHGEMSLGEARALTADYRAQANKGVDPRKPKPSVLTFEDVVDRFIEQWAKPSQRSWQQTERILKQSCKPWLKTAMAEITKADARTLIRGFINEGHPYKASVTKAWLRKLWRWAAGEDLVAAPIMDALGIPIEKQPHERFYDDAETAAIWNASDCLSDPAHTAYFKLLVLLAPRKSALAGMKWSDIEVKDGHQIWTTPHEFTKTKKSSAKKRVYRTPLPPLAQRILKGLPRRDGEDRVFATMPLPTTWFARQLRAHGAPADFRYHSVRHSVATWLQNNGCSEWEIGLVLNHSGSGVTAGYSHGTPLKLKLELLTRWSDHVASLVQPQEGVTLLR